MAQYRDKKTTLEELMHDMCKEIKGLNHQICRVTWEAIKKLITTQLTFDRNILILDAFYVKQTKNKNATHFVVLPTSSLLAQSSLNYRSDSSEMSLTSLINITQANLFKHVSQHDKENNTINKQSVFLVYSMLFKAVKNIVKKYKNANIELDFLGRIQIYEKTFVHESQTKFFSTEKVTVRDLFVPPNFQARRNSFAKKSKREITSNNHLEVLNSQSLLMSESKQSINLKSSFNVHCQNLPSDQYLQSYQKSFKSPKNYAKYTKKPFINDFSLINHPQNIRICDDLLGAGIDPLTYDYNLSKLVDNTNNLLQKQFTKPDKAKTRFPCVIDKFARTIASQLTGVKISTSSVVRIGSNYSPLVRNLYMDLTKKKIMFVPQQVTIKLQGDKSKQITPATQSQEYLFLIKQLKFDDKKFQQKIKLRQTIYKRYRQYLKNHIPNECIAPIKKETLEKIIAPIKNLVRSLGVQKGKKVFDQLINEVNKWYYYADKKAILDYILKDKSEKIRTGIYIEFSPIPDWGKGKKQHLIYASSSMENFQQNRQYLKQNLLHYADCFLQVVKQNQDSGDITLIRVAKQSQYRPTNVLYYMKKHTNHLKECIAYLNQKWVKKIVETITTNRNWKKENSHKFKQFLNSVHVQMSNKLKEIVYKSLEILSNIFQNFNFTDKDQDAKKIIHLSIGQQNGKIVVSDDLNNIFKKDIVQFQHSIIEETRKILAPECYIRQGQDRFLWGVSDDDQFYVKCKDFIKKIAQVNYNEIQEIKFSLKKFEKIYSFKEELIKWCKNSPKIDEIKQKMSIIKNLEAQIEDIPFFRKSRIAIIDCHQLKKKLLNQTKNMKNLLFETIEQIVKKNNSKVLQKIDYHSSQISKDIMSTSDYVKLSQSIQFIKKTLYQQIMGSIEQNKAILIKLYEIENTFVSHQLLRYVFQSHRACQVLKNKLLFNQQRILKQKTELQKTLRERINNFQGTAGSQLKDVNLKIESFEIRKLSNDYLNMLKQYKDKVQKNSQVMKELNRQQQDLKWALTTFSTASQLENLINPNYQLWSLVSEYDQCMKEWRHIQLCNFDHQGCQAKIQSIDTRIGKIINKLKNFSSLKIAHELQNDVKEILTQQIQIIKIFSHPGLKQRHWHLFNKKLAIPGYDLKQISYGRIKMLYDYQKNLKVLMSISNQAAKQYQIQNQKNDMHNYWYNLTFQIYSSAQESLIFVKDEFLDKQIHIIEDHLMRTILIKNSPFSKALVQMLGEWQNWLSIGKKILMGFRKSQQKFISIKDIFKIDQISRYLPIENTQFQTIQNIWKSVIKKILQQPKVNQFFKGQKILQIIQQINKKADYLKSGLSIYFHAKRLQFPRFFFVKDQQLASIFSLINQGKNNEIFNKVIKQCFNGLSQIQIKSKQDSTYIIKSLIDSIQVKSKHTQQQQNINIVARHKQKLKVSQQLNLICDSLNEEIKHQINQFLQINCLKEQFLKSYTLTALSTFMSIAFTKKLMNIFQNQNENIQNYVIKSQNEIKQFLEECDQISVTKKDFILMRKIHELQVLQYLHEEGINDLTNYEFQLIPKTYKSRNNSISVHILDKQLKYEYQYMGHDLNGYLPNTCGKIMYQFVQTLSMNEVCITKNKKSTQCIKSLSQILGKYYKVLEDPELFSQNNIFSVISGLMYSQFWINIDDNYLNLNLQALSMISTFLNEKKIKINTDLRFLMVRQNDVAINVNTGVFLTLNQQKMKKIPSHYLTYSRILSLAHDSQNDVFYKIGMKDWSLITRFKIILQLFKIENLTSQTMYSIVYELQEMIGKLPLQNLQNLIFKLLQREKSEEKQHLINEFIKVKQQKRKSIECQIFQTQKEKAKDQIESYIISKAQQLHSQLLFHDAAIVYGDHSFKTTIIKKLLKFYGITEQQCGQITINLQTYQIQSTQQQKSSQQEFSNFKYLQKALKISQKLHNSKHQIKAIIVQGVYFQQKIDILNKFMRKISEYNKTMKGISKTGCTNVPVKVIIEVNSIQNFTPFDLTKFGKIFVETTFVSIPTLFHQWCNQLTYKAEQTAFIKTLTPSFQNLISNVQKYQLQTNYSKLDRYLCSKKFLNFFNIYLDNLKSKQIQSLPEFEMENYIANSFVYSAYWSLGIGCIKHQQLKQFITYLKQTFCNQLQITSELDQNFLNQENQWIEWQNLIQEFVPQKQNEIVCNLWVPTIQNTKLYTIAIKFIQSNKPLMICGNSNGKSTLLKQVSNFQITYNSFLIDLHKKSCSNKLIGGIKEKIIYGDFKKNLILVDDVHLPNKSSIYQLLSDIVEHKTIPNISQVGILNYDIKSPSLLLTCGGKQNKSLHSSFYRLTSKMQTLYVSDMNQKQIQSVFRPYINYSLVNNDFDNNVLKLEGFIVGLISKLYGTFSEAVKISDIRMIVQSLSRINHDQFSDKNSVLKYLFLETYNILERKFEDLQGRNNFAKFLEAEYGKINGTMTKSPQQFIYNLQKQIYYDLPQNQQGKSVNLLDLKESFEKILSKKTDNSIHLSQMHTMLIQRSLHHLKNSGSHIILLSKKQSGSRTIAKIVASLKNLVYIQLGTNTNPTVFIQEIMKILKTGGKIDECICCLPNQKNKQQQFLPLLNSIISSPQFCESFSQVEIQQIIKSFNSQKKFLKKDVKRSELIKKIREKFNSIFHFFICMDEEQFYQVKENYPNMVDSCFLMQMERWPDQANYSIGKKLLNKTENSEMNDNIIKAFVEINKKLVQISSKKIKTSEPLIHQIRVFESFYNLYKTIKNSTLQASEIWSRKIQQNTQKLQTFIKQKHNFQLAHKQNFDQLSQMKNLISQKETLLQKQIKQFSIVQEKYNQSKKRLQDNQSSWFKQIQSCCTKMNDDIDQKLAKFDQNFNQNYLQFQNPVYKKIMQFYSKNKLKLNLNEAIDVLDQIKKSYYQKLYEFTSKQQLEQSLQGQDKSLFSYFFIQILNDNWNSMKQLNQRKKQLDLSQKQHIKQESKYFKKQNQYRETEDQIQELKEQIQQHQDKNAKTLQNYEDFKTKIAQTQSVIEILNQFSQVVMTKNQYSRSVQSDCVGICILLSIRLVCQQIFTQQTQNAIQSIVKQVLQSLQISFNQDDIYTLLRFQDQLKFQYLYDPQTIQQFLNFLVLQLSGLYCIGIDSSDNIYQTLNCWKSDAKQLNVLDSDQIEELKNFLAKPGYLIINQPSQMLLNYLKNLIQNKFDQKSNKKMYAITEQLNMHELAKIIFVYKNHQNIPETLFNNNKWIMNYSLSKNQIKNKILKTIRNVLEDQTSSKEVENYIQKVKDISSLDQKMHGIIVKMRKDNVNVELITQKINQVNKEKKILQKSIEEHVSNLKNQKEKLLELKTKNIDLKLYEVFNKYEIKCQQFLNILQNYLKKDSSNIDDIHEKLQNVFRNGIKKINLEIFSDIRINSTKKKIQQEKILQNIRKNTEKIFQNIKGSELYELINIFYQDHCFVISQNIELMKEYIILAGQTAGKEILYKKVEQLSTLPLVSNLNALVEVKLQKNWENLIAIIKSLRQKKMNVKLIILISPLIKIPKSLSYIYRQLNFSSPLKSLIKFHYDEMLRGQQTSQIQSIRFLSYKLSLSDHIHGQDEKYSKFKEMQSLINEQKNQLKKILLKYD